jgi:uncharacterized protein YdaU (DUF1376 family)
MHYYQFNIGDYSSHTKHLSPIEDICYRRLLDFYYLHEQPIPNDLPKITRLLCLNKEHLIDVEQVLNEFFKLTDNGWINERADKEIKQYQSFKIAGAAGAAKRWAKINNKDGIGGASGGDENPNAKQEPLNNNHKPLTINQEPSYIGTVCAAIKKEYDLHKIPLLDMSRDNPSFTACIESGATVGEFVNAAKISASKGNGFAYLLSIVINERKKAKNLDLHKGKMPQVSNREQGRQIAANSIFKDEHISHLMGNKIKEVKEI